MRIYKPTIIFLIIYLFLFPCVIRAEDSGLLWLVNRRNPLPEGFRPADLVNYQGVELRAPAKDAFSKMINAMESEGVYGLKLQSAYRTYAYQQAIFEEKVRAIMARGNNRATAEVLASRSVQFPGASEHQLGLALDVSVSGLLSQAFAKTEAGQWVAKNCYKYGFIIRYPQAKSSITNIMYEPWHLRYVGVPHAQIMTENNLTLEEYHGYLAGIHLYVVWEDMFHFLVMYTESPPAAEECFGISATEPGENGFIVTIKVPRLSTS